ncbi:ATP-binding protein [Mycobacterium sp. SMC-13]|uniref:ATP-binding protein n=1 Tax=Mycobacterium sp. SMC-13 TaxID=3381626 RepID=UPI003875E150
MANQLDQDLQPTVSVFGNLRRMRDGSIWADYRMQGLAYGYTSDERKNDALVHHRNLFRKLPDHSVIAGHIAAMNPDEIMARVIAGTDLNTRPSWRQECEGKHEFFSSTVRSTERIFTLSFPVISSDAVSDWTGIGAAGRRSRERDRAELMKAGDLAAAIITQLPSVFSFEPMTAAQMVWLWNHALSRGGPAEIFPNAVGSNVSSPAGAFAMAEFDEGERRPEKKRWLPTSFAPLVKITQPGRIGGGESWQTLLAIEALPLEGLQFPGSEFFTIADRVDGFDIDWAVRISKTSRDQAIARNGKNLRRLSEQVDERDSEISFAHDTLSEQVMLLREYNSHLETNDDEVEVSLCPIFAVAGPTRAACEDGALKLVQAFERPRIKVVAPLGGQRELWAAMNPGGTSHRSVADFSHVTISQFAAASVPLATNHLGDAKGPILALNLSGRRNQPVHTEWWRETVKDASSAVAIAGELGAGKTWLIMYMLFTLVDNGGQFLVIDRTDSGEYARPASTLAHHVIVDLSRPQWSIDPIRTLRSDLGVDAAVELLTPLFECEANSPMGITLGEVLRPEWQVDSIPSLLRVLQDGVDAGRMPNGKGLPAGWDELHRHLSFWEGRGYARSLFDPNLPAIDLNAEGIVIRTNRVEVPTTEEVASRESLAPSKIFGRAIYGLSMELGRQAFQLNKARPAAVGLDEAYHVTSTPTGLARTARLARDGRKDNISLILGSHDPVSDYPAGTALDLIPTRYVMRHRDENLARRSLAWLGIDPDRNPHIVRDLTKNTSPKGPDGKVIRGREGEGYMRDARGDIGRIKVLGPSSAVRREAMSTTPPDLQADVA